MNLEDVRDKLAADDAGKRDALVERAEVFLHGGRVHYPALSPTLHPSGLGLTPWATSQLCQRLGIPAAYFRRCPAALQDTQANHWLAQARHSAGLERPERWLLRTKGDVVRGVLSERYARVGNADVLCALLPALPARFEVAWLAVTDEALHLRFVDPALGRDVLPGDRVMAGLHVGNSEVGRRAVTIDALVWRLVCSNGLVRLVRGRSLLHQRHIHLSQAALTHALTNAVSAALVQGAGFMERLQWATTERIADREAAVKRLARAWDLSGETAARVALAWEGEPFGQAATLYGLVNAVTATAQGFAPDERYELEALSGALLEKGLSALPAARLGRHDAGEADGYGGNLLAFT